MIGILLFLLVVGTPIAFALGISGVVCIYLARGWDVAYGFMSTSAFEFSLNWGFVVLPLFMLMGMLAIAAGVTKEAFTIANYWLSKLKGGLAMATIGACGIFGATSGSSVAAAGAMCKIAVPEMRRNGYSMHLAAGSVAAGGTLSVMIPPSGILVLYGIITEQSIGKLLMAGLLPGILSALVYMVGIYVWCSIDPQIAPPNNLNVTWRMRFSSLKSGFSVLLLFVVVMGGIYSGIFTPVEAGAFGAATALVLLFAKCRENRLKILFEALTEAAKITCMFFIIIICAHFFIIGLTISGIPMLLVEYLTTLQLSPRVILLIILLIYLPLGMFLDTVSLLLLTLPIIFPVVTALGFSGIWFGILVTKLIEVSLITPPMGLNIFVMKGLLPDDVKLSTLFKGCIPFIMMDACTLLLIFFFPEIALWLPTNMF
jgi:tripartite ATP-independent transporter DctM subunit